MASIDKLWLAKKLQCSEHSIATCKKEINDNTNIYFGVFFKGLTEILLQKNMLYYSPFGQSYEQPYDFQIDIRSVEIGGKSLKALQKIAKKDHEFQLKTNITFDTLHHKRTIKLIEIQPELLGFNDEVSFEEIAKKAEEFGLYPCPLETVYHRWINYKRSDRDLHGRHMLIAVKPNTGKIFYLHVGEKPHAYCDYYKDNDIIGDQNISEKIHPEYSNIIFCLEKIEDNDKKLRIHEAENCNPNEIAILESQINENTKCYKGPLSKNVLFAMKNNNLTVYTSFPERKVTYKKLRIGTKKQSDFAEILRHGHAYSKLFPQIHNIILYKDLLFQIDPIDLDLVILCPSDLGFVKSTTLPELNKKAEEFGLYPCPFDVSFYLIPELTDDLYYDHDLCEQEIIFSTLPVCYDHNKLLLCASRPSFYRFSFETRSYNKHEIKPNHNQLVVFCLDKHKYSFWQKIKSRFL